LEHELPYLDEHVVLIPAAPERVWAALEETADSLGVPDSWPGILLAAALGTRPARGFAVSACEPQSSLVLAGRHRFSRYQLSFDLASTPDGRTRLHATSQATFPGVHGALYRLVVVGSRAHVVSVRRILRTITHRATAGQGLGR
jgi:hypothetical protein